MRIYEGGKTTKIINAFRNNSTAFAGHRYNAARTPDETWGCARLVSRGVAAKPQESFAAIAHLGPMQERVFLRVSLKFN